MQRRLLPRDVLIDCPHGVVGTGSCPFQLDVQIHCTVLVDLEFAEGTSELSTPEVFEYLLEYPREPSRLIAPWAAASHARSRLD